MVNAHDNLSDLFLNLNKIISLWYCECTGRGTGILSPGWRLAQQGPAGRTQLTLDAISLKIQSSCALIKGDMKVAVDSLFISEGIFNELKAPTRPE